MVLTSIHTIKGSLTKYGKPNDHRQYFTPESFYPWLKTAPVVKLLFEHKENIIVGEAKSFSSDKDGLKLNQGELFDTPAGRDMKRLIDVDIVNSLSLYYTYLLSLNPEPKYAGAHEIKTVNNITEISLVMNPADPGAYIEGKQLRDEDWEAFYKRMDNYFKVKNELECDEIRDIVFSKWQEAFLAYETKSLNGQSMRI